jgi:hypothetical protein
MPYVGDRKYFQDHADRGRAKSKFYPGPFPLNQSTLSLASSAWSAMFIEWIFPSYLQLQSSDVCELSRETCRCSAAGRL